MAEPLALRIGLDEILYRTRGHDWDYGFLLQPEPLLGEGWYALYRRIFAGVEPGPEPVLLRGALGVRRGEPFFATTFTDPSRHDFQGRPIAHYLAWLGNAAEAAPGVSFGPGFVSGIAVALDAVFDLDPRRLTRAETKPLDRLLRERFQAALGPLRQVNVSVPLASPTVLRFLGTIAP